MQRIKVISSDFNKIAQRVVKFLGLGKNDTQTAVQLSPPGVDAAPIKGMVAVYSRTTSKDGSVVVGYILKDQLAKPGEHRTYSTDKNGELKFYIWQKDDGTCELGGAADNLLRFSKTKDVIDEMQDDISALKQVFQTWVPVANDGGAALKAAAGAWMAQPLVKNIDEAKIDEIKTL